MAESDKCPQCGVGLGTGEQPGSLCFACQRLRVVRARQAKDDEIARLREALEELITVADLRGDADLPHPANDDKLWTARMQTAWDVARAALGK